MRAVRFEVPEDLLQERRRTGADRWDEMWDGVLHMVPAPSGPHQRFALRLAVVLHPLAETSQLVASHETELYRPGVGRTDYRIPDLVFSQRENATDRGVEGRAELAVEMRSPDDETYDKLPFYAEMEVQELLVVDPGTCEVELFVLTDGRLVSTERLHSVALDVTFETVDGPALRVTWPDGTADVHGRV
jgi:Uma2 family endonuclease